MVDPTAAQRLAALTLLGLPAEATARDITRAYRRLAMTTHPDHADLAARDADGRFAALTDAYRTLSGTPPPRRTPTPVTVRVRPPTTRPPIVAGPVHVAPLPPTRRHGADPSR
jgi:hypothetical protein